MRGMTATPDNDYQDRFIAMAKKRLTHHITLYAASKGRQRRLVKRLDAYARDNIIGAVDLMDFAQEDITRYGRVSRETVLWHGSGRYQHAGGKAADVLGSILSAGSIRPVEDAYGIFSDGKVMTTISLTRYRMIARSYADIHGRGYREPHRYGDALTWTSYHYGLFYARAYTTHRRKLKKYYDAWHALTHDDNGHNTWGKKANLSAKDVWDVFGLGSDIPGNYPILYGLKDIRDTVRLAPVYQDYEVRVSRNIKLDEITHLEVPLSKVGEVREILAAHKVEVPVEPIELGELVASRRSFSSLLGF